MTYVNLVTGFLGSGKTTTLRHLLAHKPAGARWGVLVNEFGEVGIDGALLAEQGAVLKEIPGGCMCCVNGLPMQVGLNMLLKQHRLDRLLIEPSGLGHPKQILAMLNAESYRPWLTPQAALCVLDARQLSDPRTVNNENFRDQLACADILIANKQDCADAAARRALAHWYQHAGEGRLLVETAHGAIDAQLLMQPRRRQRPLPTPVHHHAPPDGLPSVLRALQLGAQQPWRRARSEGQGYVSCGWIFEPDTLFDRAAVLAWIRAAPVGRAKGVLRTPEGMLMVNRQGDDLNVELRQAAAEESRIALIHHGEAPWNRLQAELLKLRLTHLA
ncbi:GTP-binding protein [Pantoea sp. 1.19]|uniref:CobW family GTP-binding protein n=1 Tax=Pantoea sp. 1.19 TaxID=1925589 RepID=UPI000948BC36|nr:GTP-binding protein [Pantoea sp. 1.19]